MRQNKLLVGLDVDDVLLEFSSHLMKKLNKKFNKNYLYEDTEWSFTHLDTEEERDYAISLFNCPKFMKTLPKIPGATSFIETLQALDCEVVFITSVQPGAATERAERLIKLFPMVPKRNLIITSRKDLVTLDILVDDCLDNLVPSQAYYNFIYKRPWNTRDLTNEEMLIIQERPKQLILVNNYDEIIAWIKQIKGGQVY